MRNGKKLSESALFPAKTLLNGVSEYADDFQAVESSTLQSLKLHLNLARLPLPPGRFLSLPRARCLSALLHFHPRLKLFQSKLNASLFFFFFVFFVNRFQNAWRGQRTPLSRLSRIPNARTRSETSNRRSHNGMPRPSCSSFLWNWANSLQRITENHCGVGEPPTQNGRLPHGLCSDWPTPHFPPHPCTSDCGLLSLTIRPDSCAWQLAAPPQRVDTGDDASRHNNLPAGAWHEPHKHSALHSLAS